jgi:curved DNA-binding protein
MDYYDILKISKSASAEEIKSAYKKLVKEHHPDRGGDAEYFKKINEAYETLKDSEKRRMYDNPSTPFEFNFNSENFEDLFGTIFRNKVVKNRDIKIGLTISLENLAKSQNLIINYKLLNGNDASAEIYINPNVEHGSAISYPNLGDNSIAGLPRGNLIVYIKLLKHPIYEKSGLDLKQTIFLNTLDLITGTQIELETIHNKNILLNIPAGTNPNTILNVSKHGLSDFTSGNTGNLYISVKGKTPKVTDHEMLKRIKEINEQISASTK